MPKFSQRFKSSHKRTRSTKQAAAAGAFQKQVRSFFRQLCVCFFILCMPDIAACAKCPCSFCGEATYCHQMDLTMIPSKSLAEFSNVKRLLLHSNKIVKIKNNTFEDMPNLLEIDLHKNKIKILEKNAFYGLEGLENLHLSDNEISDVPDGVLRVMENLQGLFLDGNKLTTLPVDILHMKKLVKLNMARNQITHITWYSWFTLPRAESVLMANNPMNCDCNLLEMIKWFKTTADGLSITTDIINEKCTVENKTKCGNIEINKISTLNSLEGEPFVERTTGMLQCTAKGSPQPLIVWKTPNGKFIYPFEQKEDKYSFYNGTLVLSSMELSDVGLYTCYAQHASKKTAKIKGIRVTVTKGVKPTIVSSETAVKASNRSTVELNCNANGTPRPTITWYYPGTNVPLTNEIFARRNETSESSISYSNDKSTLSIIMFNKQLAGVWRCTATNQMGYDELNIEVQHVLKDNNTLVIIIAVVVAVVVMVIIGVTIALIILVRKRRKLEQAERSLEIQKPVQGVVGIDNQTVDVTEDQNDDAVAVEEEHKEEDPVIDNSLKQPFQHEPEVKGIRI